MEAKLFRLAGLGILIGILSGCISVPSGEDEYYDYGEVTDAWEESLYEGDLIWLIGTYWPDGEGRFTLPGRETVVARDREEIRGFYERLYDGGFFTEYEEVPPGEVLEEGRDRAVIRYVHNDVGMVEELRVERRGELWAIGYQEIYPYEPIGVNSPFMAHADLDGNGELSVGEHDYLIVSLSALLFSSHRVENPFDRIFDTDENGFIDEQERALFRRYLLRKALPALVRRSPLLAREAADLDGDGRVDAEELAGLINFLGDFNPEGENIPAGRYPLGQRIDRNGDGILDREEQEAFFYFVFTQLALLPHPENPVLEAGEGVDVPDPDASSRIRGRRVAVVGIDSATEKISEDSRKGVVLFVENSFVNTGQVKVVDRNSIEKIIDEYSFQAGGLTDEDTAVEIGKLAGAEIIVTGTLSTVGSRHYLQLRLIDVETGEVVASSLGEADGENDFLPMSHQAVERLF